MNIHLKTLLIGLGVVSAVAIIALHFHNHPIHSRVVSQTSSLPACLVAGDSIAVGVGQYAPKECTVNAKIGISSTAIISRVSPAKLVVISAGSNDPDNPRLEANLEAIRAKSPGEYRWIVPQNPKAAAAVLTVARKHGDRTFTFTPARDHVHPKNERALARTIFHAS